MTQKVMAERKQEDEETLMVMAIEHWTKQLKQVERLLIPVTLNILLTLSMWIGVYKTKTDPNSVFYYMLDPGHNRTTGNEIIDGMVNGIGCVFMLAAISFALLAMALHNYKRLVQMWLYMSCVLIIFGVFASFLVDLFRASGFETAPPVLTTLLVITYGTIGIVVFFTKKAPLCMHQFYVVCNCSLVSVFYLRMFPTHTAWFVLVCIIMWDAFAVLAPIGPLRRINEKAHEYSDQVLRFLMFTAEDRTDARLQGKPQPTTNDYVTIRSQESTTKDQETYFRTSIDSEENKYVRRRRTIHPEDDVEPEITQQQIVYTETKIPKKQTTEEINFTVYDALNDGSSIRLGMGDFVFYSLLVGKAAATHSAMCVIGSAIGILVGLVVTLTVLSSEDETTPALPVSITTALIMHFGIHLLVEPFFQQITAQNLLILL